MTKKITNTTKLVHDDPASAFVVSSLLGSEGFVEAMEAAGQAELVASEQIPTDLRGCTEADLASLGFLVGRVEPDDPLFREAGLPPGWTRASTKHAMWSHIVDDRGRKRFAIMYKAAHYDRHAHMSIVSRYGCSTYHDGSLPGRYAAVIIDGDDVIKTLGERDRDDSGAGEMLRDKCEAWLDKHHPDWRNPLAYWD